LPYFKLSWMRQQPARYSFCQITGVKLSDGRVTGSRRMVTPANGITAYARSFVFS
jgi:hypothetical protein